MKLNGDLLTKLQNFNDADIFLEKYIFRSFLLNYHVFEFELRHKIQTGWYIYIILSILNAYVIFEHHDVCNFLS